MGKVDVYFGGYLSINEVDEKESSLLGSNACIIGMPLKLVYEPDTGIFRITLDSGESLGIVNPKNKLAIREAIEDGWGSSCCLSLVWYDHSNKTFYGEVVYQYFNVKASQTTERANLENFTRKTAERIAQGKRPDVSLSGQGWDQVVTTGDWVGTDSVALPIDTKRNSGTAILKRKRSLSDKLVMSILSGSTIARWGVTIGFALVVLTILFFVCRCAMGA